MALHYNLRSSCGERPTVQPSSLWTCSRSWWRLWRQTRGSTCCRAAGGALPACLETSSQLLVRLRCTVPTPGSGKRRALHSDLKSRQPATWEEDDHQTTFNLRILILSLSKLRKAANWMLTAMSAQSGGLIGIFPRSSAEKCFARYRDPQPEDLVMYLHALRYTVSNV